MPKCLVTQEDNGVKTVEDHAYFWSGVPPKVTTSGEVGGVESMAATSTHCFKKGGTAGAVERMLLVGSMAGNRRNIYVCRSNTAVLATFEMVEKTGTLRQIDLQMMMKGALDDLLIDVRVGERNPVSLTWLRHEGPEPYDQANDKSADKCYGPSGGAWFGFFETPKMR